MSDAIRTLPEWAPYTAEPPAVTFAALVDAATRALGQDALPLLSEALRQQFELTSMWRFAQNLAQWLLRQNQVLYAEYFANRALEASNGNALARISLAHALWERRLPAAVYFQLDILRVQARSIRPRAKRALIQSNIAELHCMCAAYEHNRAELWRWYRYLRHSRTATVGALSRVAVAFSSDDAPPDAVHAAVSLALTRRLPPPASRAHGRVSRLVLRGFLDLLGLRP